MAIEGICDICGKEGNVFSTGDTYVCAECAEEGYISCDLCQGLYTKDDTVIYFLKNGQTLCEDCAIYAMNFSGLTENDIDHIYDPEEE